MSLLDKIFGKKKTPDELAKEWKNNLRAEVRALDRQVRSTKIILAFFIF